MKRTSFILTLTFIVSLQSFGQNSGEKLDSLVSVFTLNLKSEGVNRLGYAKEYCVGYVYTWEDKEYRCDYDLIYYNVYLFWQTDSSVFVKLFDNCGEFNQLEIGNSDFLRFHYENRETIVSEEIKSFEGYRMMGEDSVQTFSRTSHSCWWQLVVHNGDHSTIKKVDTYNLKEHTDGYGMEIMNNINHDYNMGLKTVEWIKRTEKELDRIHELGTFKRIK